jgi:NAD-dependent SIR2 family protein deacetylase
MQLLFYVGGVLLKEYFRLKKEYASLGDIVVVIGTSLQMNPVAALPVEVASNMAPIPLDSEE